MKASAMANAGVWSPDTTQELLQLLPLLTPEMLVALAAIAPWIAFFAAGVMVAVYMPTVTHEIKPTEHEGDSEALTGDVLDANGHVIVKAGGGAPNPNRNGIPNLTKLVAFIETQRAISKAIQQLVDSIGEFLSESEKRVYAPSPKHAPGGWGSVNPIPNNEIGQALLDSAYSSSSTKQLYNIYNGDIIKFQPDGYSGEWHAYKVRNTKKEVPTDVYREMLEDGIINKSEYNKLIHNNWYKD